MYIASGARGRAGNKGRAFTLLATDDDAVALAAVEARIGKTIPKYQSSGSPASIPAPAPIKETLKTPAKTKRRDASGKPDAPPDCSGNRFADSEHTPAFLLN